MRASTRFLIVVVCVVLVALVLSWLWVHRSITCVENSSSQNMRKPKQEQEEVIAEAHEPSLLFMTASYSFDQFISLQNVLDCVRDICNSGWNISVAIQVSMKGIDQDHPEYKILKERMYCVRTKSYIPLIIQEFGLVGFGLNSKHRSYAATHINDYDYFSYAEEDMMLTTSHLSAFVDATDTLRKALPNTWMRYQIGFLR